MLKLLLYLCLFGCIATALADHKNEDWYDDLFAPDFNPDESYEDIPHYSKETAKLHKVEHLDDDERVQNDIEQFKKQLQDDITGAENEPDIDIGDYQLEDNRFDSEMARDAAKDDPIQPFLLKDNKEEKASVNSKQEMDDDAFEDAIISYLDSKNEQNPDKDILEETKAILDEEKGNDFESIKPLSEDTSDIKDIVEETSKILEETDDKFDEKTTKSSDTKDKSYAEFISELDELKKMYKELKDDVIKSNEDSDEYDSFFTDSDEADNEYAEDYKEKSEEENASNDEPSAKALPILYLNDALPAAENSTQEVVLSEDTATTLKSETESDNENITTVSDIGTTLKSMYLPEITDLNADDKKEFAEKYKNERGAHHAATTTQEIRLSVDEVTHIVSPNYPSNYPTNQVIDYIITGDGVGIEMNVTDVAVNGFLGDYILVIPGQTKDDSSDGILFSYNVRSERRFRFTDVDRMFIRFEAMDGSQLFRGFNISLRMIMPRTDVVDEPTDEAPIIRTTMDSLTVNLGGVSLNGFFAIAEDFRKIIADMATMYINAKGIEPGLNSTLDVTRIGSQGLCFHNVPGAEQCAEIQFLVPLQYTDENLDTRLTEQDLKEMWETYSRVDPFAVRLELLGIVEFTYPNDRAVITLWLVVAGGVVISMALLAFALWRFSCFEQYTMMPSFSDADSINEKRVLDLYPTPHQTLPPLFSDDIKWVDDKYDIGRDEGYANSSYMRDDMYDMDSEDETLRTQNGRYTTDV